MAPSRKKNKAVKRKFSSVAAAALDALSSSSEEEFEDSEEYSSDENASSSSSSSSSSSEESESEDEPIQPKKKKSTAAKKVNTSKGGGSTTKYSRRHLKPLFEKGDKVYSAWWQNIKRDSEPQWFPGTIKSYSEVETNSPYGPTRYYDVKFDDGDEMDDVEDYFVFPHSDYILMMKNDFKSNWIGVKNVNDYNITGEVGKWPRIVGWYVATMDGKESEYARLSDAMDAYDNHIVQIKGKNTKRSELNRPRKWAWIFEKSDSDGNSSEEDDSKKRKRKKKKKKTKKKKKEESSGRPQKKVRQSGTKTKSPTPPKENEPSTTSPSKAEKTPTSNYKGVSYSKQDKKYVTFIEYGGKLHCLGYYTFETDAALAYDKGCNVLLAQIDSPDLNNFSTKQEYEKAFRSEMETDGQSLDIEKSYESVVEKVEVYLSKIYSEAERSVSDMKLGNRKGAEENSDEDSGDDEEDQCQASPGKKLTSDYVGVSKSKGRKVWHCAISHEGKHQNLGDYKLESDAALAWDEAVKLLRGPNAKTNFASSKDYENAKKSELAKTGLINEDAMSSSAIKIKAAEMVRKTWPTASKTPSVQTEDCLDGDLVGTAKMNKKASSYVGVTYSKPNKTWLSRIGHEYRVARLGYFMLEADAALAYDFASKLLKSSNAKRNFSTLADYEKAKKDELAKTGLGANVAMTSEAIEAKVVEVISTHFPKGVTYDSNAKAYVAQIEHGGKNHHVGYWNLRSDAALAYDETSKLLNGADCTGVNFVSQQAYLDARAKELMTKGRTSLIDPVSTIATKIKKQLSTIPCPEIDTINNAMAAKWSQYLPSTTGKDFLDSYQQSMDEILGFSGQRDDETTIVSQNVGTDAVEIDSVQEETSNNTFFKPIVESGPVQSTQPLNQEDESDDDASLFSGSDTEAEPDAAAKNGKATVNAHLSSNNNTGATTKRKEPVTAVKDFPIGCPVMWNLNGNSFQCGKVTSLPTNDTEHEVTPTKPNGQMSSSIRIPRKSLAFGLDCPVHVSSTCGDDIQLLEGKVLLCTTNKSYTILITKEGNQFQVMKGVEQERVQYRQEVGAEAYAAANGNKTSRDNKVPSQNPALTSPTKKPSTPGRDKTAEGNDSPISQEFFSSNSTITTVDSAQASARRAIGATLNQSDGINVDCRIHFPQWLIPDGVSRQRLFSHFVDEKSMANLQTIGKRTNCSLRMMGGAQPHVHIQTKQGKWATEDIRKAANDIEHALLEYIQHDGSQGRLFYDLARTCKFLHPRGSAGSSSVMQRNPFSQNKEMGWMNIVVLPYEIIEGNRRKYHGHYLIQKPTGVLGKIHRETASLGERRVFIKLCGDEFRVPTKFCTPYVFVMGDKPGQVDMAVDILQEAIQHHMRECTHCRF